jgi:hypothetical protein
VLGPLKLSTKYQADVLRNRILAHIEGDCPTTLQDWDEVAYSTQIDPSNWSSDVASSQSDDNPPEYLTRYFFSNPISFIALARECDIPIIYATVLYSLCRDSDSRQGILSCMGREDLQTLVLGKDRMMSFISGPAHEQLRIKSWTTVTAEYSDVTHCGDEQCHPPLIKDWSTILQDVMRYGDPLATFRVAALKYGKHKDEYELGYNDYGLPRTEIWFLCQVRMIRKLEELRQVLFDKLPYFFSSERNQPDLMILKWYRPTLTCVMFVLHILQLSGFMVHCGKISTLKYV